MVDPVEEKLPGACKPPEGCDGVCRVPSCASPSIVGQEDALEQKSECGCETQRGGATGRCTPSIGSKERSQDPVERAFEGTRKQRS
jgi:hypothetical protein